MKFKYHSGFIQNLKANEIFVFGSNLAGIHGAGAARLAMDKFGAKYGVGQGFKGQTYAIPTKDGNIQTLHLNSIQQFVNDFAYCTHLNPEFNFLVTAVGTGLAGYKHEDIAPMFINCNNENCYFPFEWKPYLEE